MADQIFTAGPLPAPLKYDVPGSQMMIPRACQAVFNGSGASGDYVPALIFRSQAGHVIARAILQSTVTAGDDAEVSWFPGVKHSAAGVTSASLSGSAYYQSRVGNQTITSGVVTAISFTGFTFLPGYSPGLFGLVGGNQNPVTFGDFGIAAMTLIVNWPAGNYDRYIEMTIANTDPGDTGVSPRYRSQITPDGDRMVLTAAISGGAGSPPTTVTANVFQASGVNRTITAQWDLKQLGGHIFLS